MAANIAIDADGEDAQIRSLTVYVPPFIPSERLPLLGEEKPTLNHHPVLVKRRFAILFSVVS